MKKQVIYIVANIQIISNPAIWNLFHTLDSDFDVYVFGNEKKKNINFPINNKYKSYSKLYSFLIAIKMTFLLRFLFLFKSKANRAKSFELLLYKIRLSFFKFEFNFLRKLKPNFLINLDSEARFISSGLKVNNAYFIYEIFAEQRIRNNEGNDLYKFKTNLERLSVTNANFLISACNDSLGVCLNELHKCSIEVFTYSVCPQKAYLDSNASLPLKIYYHGALYKNRGIENAILAMEKVDNAHLYIRGAGDYKEFLLSIVLEKELESKVTFLPVVPMKELPHEGRSYDIGLSLVRMNVINHQYNVGFKTFDNISSGLALISPASFPLKKMIAKYENGICYDDATVEELIKTFTYCVNNLSKVNKWKENSKKAYEKEYNPEQQKKMLVNKIKKVIK